MDELMAALKQALADYRQDLDNYEKKRKPTDGLLGFGHPLQNDPCHERLDERESLGGGEQAQYCNERLDERKEPRQRNQTLVKREPLPERPYPRP